MRRKYALAMALATVTLSSCRSTTAPTSPTGQLLNISTDGRAITLENRNAWPVFYFAVDPGFLALIDFALCNDPASSCPRVPALGSSRVAYGDIAGYHTGEADVVIYQWRLERKADGTYTATQLHTVTVPLR